MHIPPGANWQERGTTWQYIDPAGAADGAQKITIKSAPDLRSRAMLKGRGEGLPDVLEAGALAMPLLAQLVNAETGICLQTIYYQASKNSERGFQATQH